MSDLSEIIANLSPEKRNQFLARLRSNSQTEGRQTVRNVDFSSNFEYRFQSDTPFDFRPCQVEVQDPEPGCVQIRAKASSLNFRDVMIASRLYPASPGVPTNMGSDYAGIVEKVGEGVTTVKPGDEVIALHVGHVENGEVRENCHFIQTFNVFEECVCRKPVNISFAEAACIPTVFLTAYIGLIKLADLKPTEKVLIHSAAGGVGLSAVQIARWRGAEIYATAGTDEKRKFLLKQGVQQAFDSRSPSFAEALLTADIGMDVILNTLSGELMTESIKLLRPFGRFIHIDKKDVNANFMLPMSLFINGISFQFLDISLLFKNPALLNTSLQELLSLFERGDFVPIEHTVFPAPDLKKAITSLSRGTHVGKMVIQYS
jgi:NADPH:quinone reductase-like Zn-dependent oxidoreductase